MLRPLLLFAALAAIPATAAEYLLFVGESPAAASARVEVRPNLPVAPAMAAR